LQAILHQSHRAGTNLRRKFLRRIAHQTFFSGDKVSANPGAVHLWSYGCPIADSPSSLSYGTDRPRINLNGRIMSQKKHSFDRGLGNQHAIKGIPVDIGQISNSHGMPAGNR
jgi:hypothetical protein